MTTYDRPIADYMIRPVHTVSVDDPVRDAHGRLDLFRVSCLLALGRDGRAAGVLSRSDLLRAHGRAAVDLASISVGDLMTPSVVTIGRDASVRAGARAMLENRIHRLFVLDGDRGPLGVFGTKEAMRAVADQRVRAPISSVMTKPVLTLDAGEAVGSAIAQLDRAGVSGLIVVDGTTPAGVFTQVEALAARALPPATPVEQVMSYALLTLPAQTPLHRAAAFAVSARARRILAVEGGVAVGILSGLDFARLATA